MKILVDPEIFFNDRCGMVRYYGKVAEELKARGFEIDLPLLVSKSTYISGKFQWLEKIYKLPFSRRIRIKIDAYSKNSYLKKVKGGDYDLILITSPVFEDAFLKVLPANKKYLMVVHDTMRCVLGPDGLFDPAGSNADRLAYLARRAAKVVCISTIVKDDLLDLCRLEKERLVVIHTGNLLGTGNNAVPQIILPDKYLLFVGERTGRKNFRYFIQSIGALILQTPDLYVVCTGRCTIWEKDLLESLKITDQVIFIQADDHMLTHLYKKAILLAYPSLYEGFGLPVLEAMALGCAVITSDYGALKEVGGDAVHYVNPGDATSILDGVKKLLTDTKYKEQLVSEGFKQSINFTTDTMMSWFQTEIKQLCEPEFQLPATLSTENKVSASGPVYFSLVVATLSRVAELNLFLNSVVSLQGHNFEVIIVDQNDDDRLLSTIESFSRQITIKHLRLAEKNASKARNLGAAHASGSWLSFPDDDCCYTSNTLLSVENIIENNNCDLLYGTIYDFSFRQEYCPPARITGIVNCRTIRKLISEPAMFIKKTEFVNLSGFEERLGPGTSYYAGEGLDFAFRALKSRKRMFHSSAIEIMHPNLEINADAVTKIYQYSYGNGFVMARHYPLLAYRNLMMNLVVLVPRLLVKPSIKRKFYLSCIKGLVGGIVQTQKDFSN